MYSSIKQQSSTIQKPQLLLHQPNMCFHKWSIGDHDKVLKENNLETNIYVVEEMRDLRGVFPEGHNIINN